MSVSRNEYMRLWRKRNKERLGVKFRAWWQKSRVQYNAFRKTERIRFTDEVVKFYGSRCMCCHEANPSFLTIDHINSDGKKHVWPNGKRKTGWMLCSWLIKNNFPNDIAIQLLCFNCNMGKQRNKGICPHVKI